MKLALAVRENPATAVRENVGDLVARPETETSGADSEMEFEQWSRFPETDPNPPAAEASHHLREEC